MSQQHPWGAPKHHQTTGLPPISTAFAPAAPAAPAAQAHGTAPSPSGSRPSFSPAASSFPSLPASAARHVGSRKSSAASSTSSPFSPVHAGQQPAVAQLLSARSRTIASQPASHLASSAAATSQSSSSGGGASKLARASPSLSTSSTVGSPSGPVNSSSGASSQSLSRIVIAQVFLLLSQFGPLKDDKDRAKWELQSEQIRKLIDSNGMEVFTKYFRRLLTQNASHVFSGAGRPSDPSGSYQQLITEVQKLRQDPAQSTKIAEAIDTNEADLFRDFDLSAFVSHFQLDPIAKTALALACRSATKNDLRTKADVILASTSEEFLMAIARPTPAQADDLTLGFEVALLERILGEPPSNWNEEKRLQLSYAMHMRYQNLQLPLPAEVEAALQLNELTDGSQNPLVKFVQRAGPRATSTVDSCKEMLASAETRDISYQQVANVLLFMAILQSGQTYNAKNFVAALREHRTGQRLDWQDVVHAFDRENLRLAKPQFLAIYHALLPVAIASDNFDIQLLWGGNWQHEITQLAFLMCFLSSTPEELDVSQIPRLRAAFTLKLFDQASDEIKAIAERAAKHPYVSLDATTALFGMIFRTPESYQSAQMLGIPEAIINPHTAEFLISAVAVPKPWVGLQEQALKQLFEPYFLKRLRDYDFVIYGLWQQDPQWLVDRFIDLYNGDLMSLTLILEHAQAHGFLEALIRFNTDISLDLAAQAHARGLFEIEPWLHETLEQAGPIFKKILLNFLSTRASDEMQSLRDDHHPITLPLAVKTVSQLLWFLAECGLQETEILPLQRTCIQAYPRLINYGEGVDEIIDANSKNGNRLPDEADKKMQEHFKNMYSGESDVRDIINILKKYKDSQDPAEQDLFACMIHGLFDEYNCFGEYPLEALATTAVLFGGIINFNLLSRIALQVGLAMVLEAVQEYRPEDSMYKFGLQALLHFANRLSEWPNYCDQLLTVHGLQGTEIYSKAEEVVGQQIGEINGEPQNGIALSNGTNMDDLLQPSEPSVPKFTCLHVDPPLHADLYEEPDEEVQDRVLFVLNNVSERNLHDKIRDLTNAVEGRHHQWFASYLVEERAKMQPNFQQLYLDMLELFNDRQLWAEVLRETYVAIIRMLQSDSTLGSTERTHLKNLGGWLGSLTIARDYPIKFRNISFKDLLTEGYDTDRLLLVIPFTCKVLVQAAKSTVFRPPNPWLTEIIRVLMELYHYADLKLNQKFEIEVLCKGLDLDHKEIEPSDSIRARPPPEEEYIGNIPPDGLEPFSDLSIMTLNRTRGPSERFSSAAITAALPDFTNQLIYPPNGNSVVPPNTLKKIFLTAVQQAIQEIIAPVVERSVTIAAISTSQLINKDFAMEPDEEKLRTAAHTVVKSLSGALALVTCKEPLRMSIMNNIRVMARDLPEQALPEGHVLMFVNDNLDLVCSTVEQAAEISSMTEIDMQIEESVRVRRLFRNTRPNETFKDANTSAWAFYIPEPYKQTSGGLNREQLAIYEDFGRQSRGAPHPNNVSQDSGRNLPDVLQDQYSTVPNITTPAGAPAEPRQVVQQSRLAGLPGTQATQNQQQLNGYLDSAVQDRPQRSVEELLHELTRNIKEAPEERLSDLQSTSPIYENFEQLVQAIENAPSNKDTWAYRIAGQVTNHLFSEQLRRLEVEVLTRLLANLCSISVQTSRQVLIWLATMHDDDRIFNAPVMICLMDVGLMDMHRLNTIIAKALAQRRVAAVEMLSSLMDDVLLNEHPSALRADFALSVDALIGWLTEDPSLEVGKQLIAKLQVAPVEQALTPPATGNKDQLEYIFDEWVHLQLPDTPKKTIAAFIYQMHQNKVMETQIDSIEFIRTCVDASAAAYEHEEFLPYGGNADVATVKVDALAKLIVSLVVYQEEQDDPVQQNKAKYLDSVLTVVILVICNHLKARPDRFNPKVFFRLFSTMLFEVNTAVKDNIFTEHKSEIFLAIARAFLALQPQHFPLLTFSWLALVSHRIFVPAMLEDSLQEEDTKEKRWNVYAQLMETLLNYTGQLIKPTGETIISQNFYRGVLRVLLVIHHDYPEFLAENHFRFCNSVPMHCTQLRNLIVSAYPSVILEMPDPFSAGLKVDRIEDVRQAPIIRADLEKILADADIKESLDNLLNASDLDAGNVQSVCNAVYFTEPKEAGFELVSTTTDPVLIHAIVLYIGTTALAAQGLKGPNFNPSSPAAKLLEALAKELQPEARFHFISAIANQLRWPNAHTHFFSHGLLHLFGPPNSDSQALEVQQVITRVLLERLLVHRPHPWGLIITLLEILKNRTYAFWDLPFVKAAPEVERLLNALFTHAQQSPRPLV